MKVLFVLKERNVYNQEEGYYAGLNSGLYNSASFVAEMLSENDVEVEFEQVFDANSIDKWVYTYKPDMVIIEALWVTPAKLQELQRLHPTVEWIVRLHSEIAFLANEGIAIEWLKEYDKIPNVKIAANSYFTIDALEQILTNCVLYFPNYYPEQRKIVHIGCFGSIRPLKNHLTQAFAAIKYADGEDQILHFHINSSRQEQRGENVLKNLRALFSGSIHKLIEHDWLDHDEFVKLVRQMDAGLQVSFSETYNIVAADFVDNYIPIVTSSEITFVVPTCHASTKNVQEICDKLVYTINNRYTTIANKRLLERNSKKAKEIILDIVKKN